MATTQDNVWKKLFQLERKLDQIYSDLEDMILDTQILVKFGLFSKVDFDVLMDEVFDFRWKSRV